jgi:CRP-like cAMP-binding protein
MIDLRVELVIQFVSQLVDFSAEELDYLRKKISLEKYKKGDFLIHTSKLNDKLFFITKGIVRNLTIDESGQEFTYDFRAEGMVVSEHISYLNQSLPAHCSQCLSDCEVVVIHKMDLDLFYQTSKHGDRLGRILYEQVIVDLLHNRIDRQTKSIFQRFQELGNYFPKIYQRVPQHIIASYLGTSTVHLSRLKSQKS